MTVYIVRRQSGNGSDRPEIDVFADWELAKSWAYILGVEAEEKAVIDAATLRKMLYTYKGES
jgi:hypothetical protein